MRRVLSLWLTECVALPCANTLGYARTAGLRLLSVRLFYWVSL
jgi:hypothetical protein